MLLTIERAGKMLKLFTLETPEWGITELSKALEWSTSTTHDLAASLAEIGLLKKNKKRRYTIGWRIVELSQVVLQSNTLQVEARKGMEQFAAEHDLTIQLGVMAGGKILFADKIVSKNAPLSTVLTPDMRYNAHCTAAGKVILANLSTPARQQVLSEHGLNPMTPKSIQSPMKLYGELARIREQGHASAFEEWAIGLGSVAAPVLDYAGQVVAALSVTADIQQFERHQDEYRNAVVRTARQVSKQLGHAHFISASK